MSAPPPSPQSSPAISCQCAACIGARDKRRPFCSTVIAAKAGVSRRSYQHQVADFAQRLDWPAASAMHRAWSWRRNRATWHRPGSSTSSLWFSLQMVKGVSPLVRGVHHAFKSAPRVSGKNKTPTTNAKSKNPAGYAKPASGAPNLLAISVTMYGASPPIQPAARLCGSPTAV